MKKSPKDKKQEVNQEIISEGQTMPSSNPNGPTIESLTADLQRVQAEFINYKKRHSQISTAEMMNDRFWTTLSYQSNTSFVRYLEMKKQ